jgi:hypothetical protein
MALAALVEDFDNAVGNMVAALNALRDQAVNAAVNADPVQRELDTANARIVDLTKQFVAATGKDPD